MAFRVLAADQHLDFRTISDFRKQHLAALTDLFVPVLTLCWRAGLVKLGHVALDGTKVIVSKAYPFQMFPKNKKPGVSTPFKGKEQQKSASQ